jgi:predicted DNA-binding transcriptional regulator YafY
MNRTERLYALVEEMRAVSPRTRSAAWLARRFEVSMRTVERDLEALRQLRIKDVNRARREFRASGRRRGECH